MSVGGNQKLRTALIFFLAASFAFMSNQAAFANEHHERAIVAAGNYGLRAGNYIGVVIYYGPDNEATPEEAGEWVRSKIINRLQVRERRDPRIQPENFHIAYFVQHDPEGNPGISVSYYLGIAGIDAREIRASVTDEVLDQLIDKRLAATRLLNRPL